MTTVLAATALLIYLAGITILAVAWPKGIQQHPEIQRAAEAQPIAVALWLTLITVAWPVTVPYTLITSIRRSTR